MANLNSCQPIYGGFENEMYLKEARVATTSEILEMNLKLALSLAVSVVKKIRLTVCSA